MSANDRQVGGNHYASNYKHWDMVIATGAGYFEGQATKYLARCYTAGKTVQDLEKSKHYVEKLLENLAALQPIARKPTHVITFELHCFCATNSIAGSRRTAFFLIIGWLRGEDLVAAINIIDRLLEEAVATATVPLEDSNKHAGRA